MAKRSLSLSSRIFFYMILLVVLASILIAAVTVYQYNEQSQDYHRKRLERKEVQLMSSINYVLKESSWEIKTDNLELIFKLHHNRLAGIRRIKRMLDDRAKLLLKALVERYITEGQPVGSRTLSRASGLELSPATIRNVMSDLEELGLIVSPQGR